MAVFNHVSLKDFSLIKFVGRGREGKGKVRRKEGRED